MACWTEFTWSQISKRWFLNTWTRVIFFCMFSAWVLRNEKGIQLGLLNPRTLSFVASHLFLIFLWLDKVFDSVGFCWIVNDQILLKWKWSASELVAACHPTSPTPLLPGPSENRGGTVGYRFRALFQSDCCGLRASRASVGHRQSYKPNQVWTGFDFPMTHHWSFVQVITTMQYSS